MAGPQSLLIDLYVPQAPASHSQRVELFDGANLEDLIDGRTPLIEAASQGQLQIAQFLLSSGARVDTRNPNGETALHHAASSGMAKALLKAGADVGRGTGGAAPRSTWPPRMGTRRSERF